MEYAYLGSNAISFVVWFFLFWHRKDLRKMMLAMGVCAMPLAFFDLVFVPAYWKPVTLFTYTDWHRGLFVLIYSWWHRCGAPGRRGIF